MTDAQNTDRLLARDTDWIGDALDALPFIDADGIVRGTVADHFGPWLER